MQNSKRIAGSEKPSDLRPQSKRFSSFLAVCAVLPLLSACVSLDVERSLDGGKTTETRVLVIETNEIDGVSNCLGCQAVASISGARHRWCVLAIALSIVSSFRMQATSASFFGFPAARSRA